MPPFLVTLAWVDAMVTKPPRQLGAWTVHKLCPPSLLIHVLAIVSEPEGSSRGCAFEKVLHVRPPWPRPCPVIVVGVWSPIEPGFLKCIVRHIYDCGFYFHSARQALTREPQL